MPEVVATAIAKQEYAKSVEANTLLVQLSSYSVEWPTLDWHRNRYRLVVVTSRPRISQAVSLCVGCCSFAA